MKIKKNILGALDITLIDKWVLSIVKNQGVLPSAECIQRKHKNIKKEYKQRKKHNDIS